MKTSDRDSAQRVAIVSGGLGGIGLAICSALADADCKVVAADVPPPPERLEEFRRAAEGLSVEHLPLDVRDHAQCHELVAEVEGRHGSVDLLVNCAGITRDVTLRKMRREQWDDVLEVNLTGVFNLCQAVADGMARRGFGRIVNISSVNGQTGQFGQTNYSAAKAGVHGFTMALARELASKGVTVNCVAPGYCETPMAMAVPDAVRQQIVDAIPLKRMAQPWEIARVVRFLAADDSAYITGALIPVNGGLFMSF